MKLDNAIQWTWPEKEREEGFIRKLTGTGSTSNRGVFKSWELVTVEMNFKANPINEDGTKVLLNTIATGNTTAIDKVSIWSAQILHSDRTYQ